MSKPSELLSNLYPIIEKRFLLEQVKGSLLKEELTEQLQLFFNRLIQALETGDTSWLDPILQTWADSLTQTDLEHEEMVVNEFLNQIVFIIHQTTLEHTSVEEYQQLSSLLFPIYIDIINKTSKLEINEKFNYLTRQVDSARQEISKLDKNKSKFVAVAAHELKTPLTLIEGYTSMLLDVILKQNQSDLLVFVNGILNGSKRLRGIIEDMLDVSLLENNLLELNYQSFWLNRVIEFVLLDVSTDIQERKIQINIQEFDGYKSINYGDSVRLIQLFRNLISNAIKFTPDGGVITISGRTLPGFVEIKITDSGIGIDPEDQNIIFDKFNHLGNVALHSSGKTKFKGGGPGLGLPIAKGIAEAHGGSIWVESSGYSEIDFPGSTFHVLIPLLDKIPGTSNIKKGFANE